MKKLLLFIFGVVSLSSYSQNSTFKKVILNTVDTVLPFTTSNNQFLQNAVFDNNSTRVEAYTTQLTGAPSNALYWTRTTSTSSRKGYITVPVTDNCDLVIGDAGNKILYTYRGPGDIRFTVFEFDGTNYVQDTSGFVADVVYTPPVRVMQYTSPRLCIDQNDNVVVFYRSLDGVAPGSDTIHHFARTGNIHGHWTNYSNSFNAYIVDNGLPLPAKYSTSSGNVGITKYSSNNMVNFVFPVSSVNNTNFIYHAQVTFNDLASGNYSNLSQRALDSSSTDEFRYPTIDGGNKQTSTTIADDWVAAYDHIHGKNDIKVAKGFNGSFITSSFFSTMLNLDRQLGPPELHYSNEEIALCFSSNDTATSCKNDWDSFYLKLDSNLGVTSMQEFIRINTDDYLAGSQRAVSLATAVTNSSQYIIYFNESSNEIISSSLVETIPCDEFIGIPEEVIDMAESNLTKVEYYSIQGELIKQSTLPSLFGLPKNIILLQVKYYSDGNIQTSKIKIQ